MWYKMEGKDSDVVLNSRVALSRNLEDIPFADRMTEEQASALVERMQNIYRADAGWSFTDLSSAGEEQKRAMAEQRILPADMIGKKSPAAVFQNEDYTVAVVVGGADHVRIEAVAPGNNLTAALEKAFDAEALLDENAPIAFAEQFGYVTRNPELLGTGMRASVSVHLPLCTETGWMARAAFRMAREGISVRSADGSGPATCVYRVSNRETMGMSEEEIAKAVTEAAEKLVGREREYREALGEDRREDLAESVRRAYGMLLYAGALAPSEFVSAYSDMRMAAAMNLVDLPVPLADEALFTCLPHTLAAAEEGKSGRELDRARAVRVKEILSRAGLANRD